jgi:hypothetical protein
MKSPYNYQDPFYINEEQFRETDPNLEGREMRQQRRQQRRFARKYGDVNFAQFAQPAQDPGLMEDVSQLQYQQNVMNTKMQAPSAFAMRNNKSMMERANDKKSSYTAHGSVYGHDSAGDASKGPLMKKGCSRGKY